MQKEKLNLEDLKVVKLGEGTEETDKGEVNKHRLVLKQESETEKITVTIVKEGTTGFGNGFQVDEKLDLILGTNQTRLDEHEAEPEAEVPENVVKVSGQGKHPA